MSRLALLAFIAVVACAPRPAVKYSAVKGPLTDNQFDSYTLAGSRISIQRKQDSTPLTVSDFEVRSTPVESGTIFALERTGPVGVSTDVKLSKLANTNLVSEIGVEVNDERVALLKSAGGALVALATVVPFAAEEAVDVTTLPLHLDLVPELAKAHSRDKVVLRPAEGVIVEIGTVPPDAVEVWSLQFGRAAHHFLYSACRAATLTATVARSDQDRVTITAHFKVADPAFVQRVGLPLKGSVRAHSECGISVSSEKAAVSSALEVANALAEQAKAIKAAIDAARKAAEK